MTKVPSRFLVVLMLIFAFAGDMTTAAFAGPLPFRVLRHVEVPLGIFGRHPRVEKFFGDTHRLVDPAVSEGLWLEKPIRPARPVDPLWEK